MITVLALRPSFVRALAVRHCACALRGLLLVGFMICSLMTYFRPSGSRRTMAPLMTSKHFLAWSCELAAV